MYSNLKEKSSIFLRDISEKKDKHTEKFIGLALRFYKSNVKITIK